MTKDTQIGLAFYGTRRYLYGTKQATNNKGVINMSKTKREKAVATRLREMRIKQELSQEALAEASGIDRKTVNRIENQHFSPNLETLFRLCDAIGVNPSELLKGI